MARLAAAETDRAAEVASPASSVTLWSSSALGVLLATTVPLASLVALASLAIASVSPVLSLVPPTLVAVVVVLAVPVLGLTVGLWGRRLSLRVEAGRCHSWHGPLWNTVCVRTPVRRGGGCYGGPGGGGGAYPAVGVNSRVLFHGGRPPDGLAAAWSSLASSCGFVNRPCSA